MNKSLDILEFNKIKDRLCAFAHSPQVSKNLLSLIPSLDEAECIRNIEDTTAARKILDVHGAPPLPHTGEIISILKLCSSGAMPTADQLSSVQQFAASCRRLASYLARAEGQDARISSYGKSIYSLDVLNAEIERCIRAGRVDSNASNVLHDIRRKIEQMQIQIKEKSETLLRNNKKWFSEDFVSMRNGHYVLPVKKQFRNSFDGSVIEISASGGTYFMEPASVSKLQSTLHDLEIAEDNEVRRVLYELAALVCNHELEITQNIDGAERLDFIFAKGRLSQEMDGTPATLTTRRAMNIRSGRHPLLPPESCVPLNFHMDEGTNGVIITGPNTGGKTVALKTVGLLSVMTQSGLHIPAAPGSLICMHSDYSCDIGDHQSITENLSTFSGHMTRIIAILEHIGPESLVILDELGSGTDPAEGMGIAVAVLDELRVRGCMFLVTTHYPEVRDYALSTDGIVSARMAFDKETLTPLYKLELGFVGESCALHIAQRLGLPEHILKRAHAAAYHGKKSEPTHSENDMAFNDTGTHNHATPTSKIKRKKEATQSTIQIFQMGDSVKISPYDEIGIVYKPADDDGNVCVQIKGEKTWINHKRVKLHIPADQLYPADYDFSIIFDSVENRKARHMLDKGSSKHAVIHYDE